MVETADGTSSDDEVYDAVDLISDSEDDETTVELDEEQNIICSEEEIDTVPAGDSMQKRGSLDDDDDNIRVDNEDGSKELKANLQGSRILGRVPPSDAECAYMNPYFANEMEMFNAANVCERTQSTAFPETKHVHFQDEIFDSDGSCSVTSSDDESGLLGPFMCQDQLDPDFRSLIENDEDEDDGDEDQDDEEEEIQTTLRFECDEKDPLEGFALEIGEGDTTDEDLPPPQSIARTRSVLRRLSMSSIDTEDGYHPNTPRRPLPGSKLCRLGPSMGSWVADPSKPIAVVDSSGKRLVIFPAQKPTQRCSDLISTIHSSDTSTVGGSPRRTPTPSFSPIEREAGDVSGQELLSPTLSSGANVMVGTFLSSVARNEFRVPGRFFYPSEDSSPFLHSGNRRRCASSIHQAVFEEDEAGDDDDDDDELMLNVHDFIDFGDGSSSSDESPSKKLVSSQHVIPGSRKRRRTVTSGSTLGSRKWNRKIKSHKRIKSL